MLTPDLLRDREKGSRCIHMSTNSTQVNTGLGIPETLLLILMHTMSNRPEQGLSKNG